MIKQSRQNPAQSDTFRDIPVVQEGESQEGIRDRKRSVAQSFEGLLMLIKDSTQGSSVWRHI
jgi:hypothetical protein